MADNKKIYVLDTNVLVHDPKALYGFPDGEIALPIMVLEELDRFKGETTQRGFSSRSTIRQLDALRSHGSLSDGITLENGGTLQVLFATPEEVCKSPLSPIVTDNEILAIAYCLKKLGNDVRFISKDLNARVKADVIGIPAFDYDKDSVSKERIYKGWVSVDVPALQLKKDFPTLLHDVVKEQNLYENEFILLQSKNNPQNTVVYRYLGNDKFKLVQPYQMKWPLQARNPQQLMALDLLLDNNVQFVSLVGSAGTGKTFLALLAALQKVLVDHEYEKILVTRPVIPLGPDIGFLPGDVHEKLRSWMQPVYDNLEFIAHATTATVASQQPQEDQSQFGKKYKKNKKFTQRLVPPPDELIREGKLSLEAITYMRGRSIPYQFIIIDEVQNLTPHEVKTLISRVGEGSKIIIAGDPYQIDSPYLDFSSNGLMVATSKFKGQSIFGTVFLESSERSELSRLAQELL